MVEEHSDKGHSNCECPAAEMSLIHLRNKKEANVAGANWGRSREVVECISRHIQRLDQADPILVKSLSLNINI